MTDRIDPAVLPEKLSRAETKVAAIQSELTRLAARVEAVGLADSVGALLRRHRAEAPDVGMYRRFIRMRQERIGGVQLQQIKLREQREANRRLQDLLTERFRSGQIQAADVLRQRQLVQVHINRVIASMQQVQIVNYHLVFALKSG